MYLAIESSCDESSLAVFDPQRGMVDQWTHSQIALHQRYGGVVPDLASREHLAHFTPLLQAFLERHSPAAITQLAVTNGPGLAGCLALGIALGKALALAWQRPLSGVNHLRGHAFSPFIGLHAEDPATFNERFDELLPHLGLIVSGGNTLAFKLDRGPRIAVLAGTVDDAAGEALDKGAKLLGMPYPGGPLIEQNARNGQADAYDFPRALDEADAAVRFSFSGLKTSLRYRLEKYSDTALTDAMADICASYQQAVIDQLCIKTARLLGTDSFRSLGLSGGVANNQTLQGGIKALAAQQTLPCLIAQPAHTGDNAAMIAFAAWLDPAGTQQGPAASLSFTPSLKLA